MAPDVLDVESMLIVLGLFSSLVALASSCGQEVATAALGGRASEMAQQLLISPRCASASPAQLISLIKYFVRLAPEPQCALKAVVDQIVCTLKPSAASEEMEMFAVAQCSSLLPVLFKVAIECLSGLLATHTTALEKARIDDLDAQPALKDVQTALVLLRDLTANVKHASEVDGCKERELIAALLRHGKPITQALMKLLPELGHHVDKYKQLVCFSLFLVTGSW